MHSSRRTRAASLILFAFYFGCSGSDGDGATDDVGNSDGGSRGDTYAPGGDAGGDGGLPPSDIGGGDGALPDSNVPPGTDTGTPPPSDTGVPPTGDGGVTTGPTGCKALTIAAGTAVEGTAADTFAWSDDACQPRTAALLRNDKADAFGEHGGYLRAYSYVSGGKTHAIKGTGSNGWQGFGYIINHYASTASETQHIGGTWKTVLAGKHHAIHEFKLRVSPGGNVDVTVHWMFATGRAHPLFAITYDSTPAGPDKVKADSRAPYGDLAWDDGKGGAVDGVGWGDKYRFATTSAPVTPHSSWSYAGANTIPHAFEWSSSTDSEMGLVSTETFDAHLLGGDYGGGLLSSSWGKTGKDLLTDIADWDWPFQLNQYELPYVTNSHRVAWGTTYGAVGQRSYSSFGKTLSGYPYLSYTVAVVLGAHTTSAVAAQVAELERVQTVKLSASRGTVAKDGLAGVGRTDKATFSMLGFDPVYAAWTVDAAANAATLTLDTGGGTLHDPMIVLRNFSATAAPTRVVLGGKTLVADVDYFASVDTAGQRLWLTLNGAVSGAPVLSVD